MSKYTPDNASSWNSVATFKAGVAHLHSLATTALRSLTQAVNQPIIQTWNTLSSKNPPLRAMIVHRYAIPSSRSISAAEGFFGFMPIHSYDHERYILEVAHGTNKYQVEVPHSYYQNSNIGDGIDIHSL
ncbi:hypothetical protein [Rouxiella sp. Mn2063]|uniref:hypothetical protein n=1 Tax=Rouxiella sp. Mn2063 TaxID=3395262 RepID=UPI003BBBDDCA